MEETIFNVLFAAEEMIGLDRNHLYGIPQEQVKEIIKQDCPDVIAE